MDLKYYSTLLNKVITRSEFYQDVINITKQHCDYNEQMISKIIKNIYESNSKLKLPAFKLMNKIMLEVGPEFSKLFKDSLFDILNHLLTHLTSIKAVEGIVTLRFQWSNMGFDESFLSDIDEKINCKHSHWFKVIQKIQSKPVISSLKRATPPCQAGSDIPKKKSYVMISPCPPKTPILNSSEPIAVPCQSIAEPCQSMSGPCQPVYRPFAPPCGPRQPLVQPYPPQCGPRQPIIRPFPPPCGPRQPIIQPYQPQCGPRQPLVQLYPPQCGPRQPIVRPCQPQCGTRQPIARPGQPIPRLGQPIARSSQPRPCINSSPQQQPLKQPSAQFNNTPSSFQSPQIKKPYKPEPAINSSFCQNRPQIPQQQPTVYPVNVFTPSKIPTTPFTSVVSNTTDSCPLNKNPLPEINYELLKNILLKVAEQEKSSSSSISTTVSSTLPSTEPSSNTNKVFNNVMSYFDLTPLKYNVDSFSKFKEDNYQKLYSVKQCSECLLRHDIHINSCPNKLEYRLYSQTTCQWVAPKIVKIPTPEKPKEPTCPLPINLRCPICNDTFDKVLDPESGDMHYRNAIAKEDIAYHPYCIEYA